MFEIGTGDRGRGGHEEDTRHDSRFEIGLFDEHRVRWEGVGIPRAQQLFVVVGIDHDLELEEPRALEQFAGPVAVDLFAGNLNHDAVIALSRDH